MSAQPKEAALSKDSSETDVPGESHDYSEKPSEPSRTKDIYYKEEDSYENLNYPPPWKYERWFIGGYNQSRMLKFKKPKTMYTAINLFAGKESPIADWLLIAHAPKVLL